MATTLDDVIAQVNALTVRINALESGSKTVNELTLKTPLDNTEEIPIAGEKKITTQQISDLVVANVSSLIDNKENVLKSYVQKTSSYTVENDDSTIECTSGTFTVTLPTAIGIGGKEFKIVNSGNGLITVDCFGSQTINGETTIILTNGDSMTVQSNNTNYII